MKILFAVFAATVFLSACDCVQVASGVVLDQSTQQPIDSVAIGKLDKASPAQPYSYTHVYTDSAGHYEYRDISGGMFGCPDLKLLFFKNGYNTIRLNFPSGAHGDTIYLEPEVSDTVAKEEEEEEEESDPNCVFDTSAYEFTSEALRNFKRDIRFAWDDQEKIATTVLENGDTLTLHIGGCDHFSFSAILSTTISWDDTERLTEKARWLAVTFFSYGFDTKYDECISKGAFREIETYTRDRTLARAYEIIDPDTAITNAVYAGFCFWKMKANRTKIEIGGYLN